MLKKIVAFFMTFFIAGSLASCDRSTDIEDLSSKENTLKNAITAYVDKTVYPTYRSMADASVELFEMCKTIKKNFEKGTLTSSDIVRAGDAWKKSRKYWELSEAFLFGPAADHYIDPHIDSWPLDKDAMENLLLELRKGAHYTIDNNFGYGLLGFHSLEFLLFELDESGNQSLVHSTNYSPEDLTYMLLVAEDLRNQCIYLEACWCGKENISDIKQEILEEAAIEPGDDYGWMMVNAGQPGSIFKTYQEAAEEIIQGCIDIADEVGTVKIGRPHEGSTKEDRNYIESPYSLNSIEDFIDNIRSIENSYFGDTGSSTLSSYIKSIDQDLDSRVRDAIERSKTAISAIPEPFARYATGPEAAEAVKTVGTDLVKVLNEVHDTLSR